MIRTVAGIDVGLASACIAIFRDEKLRWVKMIPRTPDRKRIDVVWLHRALKDSEADIAYIENATAMGAGTMSAYLKAAGAIEATVTLAGADSVYVMPSVWKKRFGLLHSDKKASVLMARKMFPKRDAYFEFWNSHNAAESSLLALYGAERCDLVKLAA
jgi:hypothetical protein